MTDEDISNWIAYLSTCNDVEKARIDNQLQREISNLEALVFGNRHTMFKMVNPQQTTKKEWAQVLEALEDKLTYMRINFYYDY